MYRALFGGSNPGNIATQRNAAVATLEMEMKTSGANNL